MNSPRRGSPARSRSSARTARKPCRWVRAYRAGGEFRQRSLGSIAHLAWAKLAAAPARIICAAATTRESHAMLERTPPQFRELQEITMQTDTRDILAHATRQAESHEDYFLVDIDAHVTETSFWPEILAMIDNDVIRQMGEADRRPPRQRQHRAAQQLAGHPLPARLWPHPASAGAAGEGREDRASTISPSWRAARWTRSASTIRSCFRRRC